MVRDHGATTPQEYPMELVIVTLSLGTLILLATHMLDYAAESPPPRSNDRRMPEDNEPDVPLPFEGAESYDRAA
jgi:hypothetical protein